MRFKTFAVNTTFAWWPLRLAETVNGRREWAWLERVDVLATSNGLYHRRGIPADPIEIGKRAEDVASGKIVVRQGA